MPPAPPSPLPTAIAMAAPSTIVTVCDSVRHAAYLGGYCAAKLPLGMEPLLMMVPKEPLRHSMGGVLIPSNHAPLPIGLDAAVMVDIV